MSYHSGYQLGGRGIFAVCSREWDPISKTFIKTTDPQRVECCLKQCKPAIEYCHDRCTNDLDLIFNNDENTTDEVRNKERQQCHSSCEDARFICTDTCRLISKDMEILNNNFINCAVNMGCERKQDLLPDKQCITNNLTEIYQCCQKQCNPLVRDCESHCKFLQDNFLNPALPGLQSYLDDDKSSTVNTKLNYIKTEDTEEPNLYSFGLVAFIMVLFVFGYATYKKYNI